MAENKVQFGLKNAHYAVLTETVAGGVVSYSWGTPVAIPGAVSLALDASGDISNFYADNIVYFSSQGAESYSGTLEVARFPEQMLSDIWGQTPNQTDNVIIASTSPAPVRFALLYQIDGDQDNQLFVMYNCTATKPGLGSSTITETTEPQTQSVTITATPLQDDTIFARTTQNTTEAVRNAWFSAVYRG